MQLQEALSTLRALHTRRGWLILGAVFLVFCGVLPALHTFTSASSPLHVPEYVISVLGKFLCYGIVALAMDLIWGFTGILSLGHGVFFALGGYAIGMYLMRQIGRDGNYHSDLPDFMAE